jgi:hypothetical protein
LCETRAKEGEQSRVNSAGVGLPVLAGAPRGPMGSVYELGQLIRAPRIAAEEVGLETWVALGLFLAELDCLCSCGRSAR